MNTSDIRIFKDFDALAEICLQWLIEKTTQQPVVAIALSGGSTPQSLFKALKGKDWGKVNMHALRLFWGDERCVSPDSSESNYANAKRALLDALPISQEQIFRIRGENEPAVEAARYAQVLSNQVAIQESFPRFDLVILGLGEDGHTASIFPGNEALFHTREWSVVTQHPQTGQQRISLTGSLINNAAEVVFLVTGASKAPLLAELFLPHRKAAYPADYVQPSNGRCRWFIDPSAASMLRI